MLSYLERKFTDNTPTAKHERIMEKLVNLYNCGRLDDITTLMKDHSTNRSTSANNYDTFLYQSLILRRNKRMAQRVDQIIQNRGDQNRLKFFAVGLGK